MTVPLQVTFRGLERSDAIEAAVRRHAARLSRFHGRVTGCHVSVELPHRHHHKGNVFRVLVDVVVLGEEIVVSREPGRDHAHEDVYVALRDAFNAAVRRIEDVTRRPRAERRPHDGPLVGRVMRLSFDERWGFLETPDGLEVYFHENSVLGGKFDQLRVGDPVRVVIAEAGSARGPQASTVELRS